MNLLKYRSMYIQPYINIDCTRHIEGYLETLE